MTEPHPYAVAGPDPDRVAAAVVSCPAVSALSGGRFGEVATYLPGRRVTGVRIEPTGVEVHVVGRYGVPVTQIADQVRAALGPLVAGRPVLVAVDDLDIDLPDQGQPADDEMSPAPDITATGPEPGGASHNRLRSDHL